MIHNNRRIQEGRRTNKQLKGRGDNWSWGTRMIKKPIARPLFYHVRKPARLVIPQFLKLPDEASLPFSGVRHADWSLLNHQGNNRGLVPIRFCCV